MSSGAAAAAAAGDARLRAASGAAPPMDEAVFMSTDYNLLNTGDLNILSSGFNAMLPSEELLRFVPTPEEATASRSTAWL
jgi:hypothetical protein